MTTMKRIDVAQVPELRKALRPLLVPEAAETIPQIRTTVENKGGQFGVTSVFRTYEDQARLRQRWEFWKAWEKSDRTAKAPPKQAYSARPGGSWHEAGRAVDFKVRAWDAKQSKRVSLLCFPNVAEEDQLLTFWRIVKPLGWNPIINKPSIDMSECWHFEFHGIWAAAVEAVGQREAVKAAILDIGNTTDETGMRFIQAQLIRLGRFDIGPIDGVLGRRTEQALTALGVAADSTAAETLKRM